MRNKIFKAARTGGRGGFQHERLLIFTEHRDTLEHLQHRFEALGYTGQIAAIHGGMDVEERERQRIFSCRLLNAAGKIFRTRTRRAHASCWRRMRRVKASICNLHG